jgi:hypothetical protein
MKSAFVLSLFFIVEYWLTSFVMTHIFTDGLALGLLVACFLVMLLKLAAPVGLFYILRRLREQLPGVPFPGLVAWSLGVRVMLFAALPEAAFIYVYNQWIAPDALHLIAQNTVHALETWQQTLGADALSTETIDLYRQAATPTAIEAAVQTLSQDVMIGIFLMLIIAPIVRRRGTATPPEAPTQPQ